MALLITLATNLTGAILSTRSGTLESMKSIARIVGTSCVAAVTLDDSGAANETLKALAVEPRIEFSRICKADGSILAQYYRNPNAGYRIGVGIHDERMVKAILANGTFSDSGSYHRFTSKNLLVLAPIVLDRSTIGVVEVSADLATLNKQLIIITLLILGILLLSSLIAYAVAFRAQHTISGPISTLTRTMKKVSQDKDYSIRIENDSRDELGILFNGFNEMLAQIQARDEMLYFTQFSVDHMSDIVIWMDREGRIVNINVAACKAQGLPREKLVKMTYSDVDPTFGADRWNGIWKKAGRKGTINFEHHYLQNTGRLVPVELNVNYLEYEGKAYLCALVRDITERNNLQAQLDLAQKMEAIGTLAGGVAHDLNNILGGLVGYPDLLLMGLPEGSPLYKPLLLVKHSGEKAAAIVQDLLTLARRGVDLHSPLNLNEVVSNFWRSAENDRIQQFHGGVSFEMNLAPDLPNILGSEVHLSKALMNLVSNAAEATPDSGRVQVSTFHCQPDEEIQGYQNIPPGDYAVLRVKDEGVGMSDEDAHHIFEPFYTKKKMG